MAKYSESDTMRSTVFRVSDVKMLRYLSGIYKSWP